MVCSPSLGVRKVEDLKTATLLHAEWHRSERVPDWPRWAKAAGASWLDVQAGPRFTSDSHAIDAAIAGHGAVIASVVLLEEELQPGVLVQPFGPLLDGDGYYFLTTAENIVWADVCAVRDWLVTPAASADGMT